MADVEWVGVCECSEPVEGRTECCCDRDGLSIEGVVCVRCGGVCVSENDSAVSG
jgi:hypothetical protein